MNIPAKQFEISTLYGSGGSRAIVAAAGSMMALHLIELICPGSIRVKWCGGISGGATMAAMYAAKVPVPIIVDYAIETDYQSLLAWHGSPLRILSAFLRQKVYEETRPCKGVLNPDKLRLFIEAIVGDYPESFWTMAVSGNSQIVFTSFGVFEIFANGQHRRLADLPPSVGTAAIASCAVPGIIDAVSLYGRYLFDGALSKYGACPVDIAIQAMSIPPETLLAVDVGDDFDKDNKSHTMWDALFGINELRALERAAAAKAAANEKQPIMVKPNIEGFCGLQFVVPAHLKWKALMESFFATIAKLDEVGMVSDEVRHAAKEIAGEYKVLTDNRSDTPEFVAAVKELLKNRNLYFEQVDENGLATRISDKHLSLPEKPAKPSRFKAIEKLKSNVSQVGLRVGRWITDRFKRS
ncbi:MAG: patatin-like phospholipase family protein [Candidatus Obscuribacterales bacterium]|nr:patatin-like phospholipase family protein [Candidatus Obscuribacterales bacterium]